MRPFDFFVDLLHPQLDFLPRALAVAVLAAVVCAIVGTHVVLRGSAFVGEAVAHAVFPGIAVAVLLGGSVLLGGAVAGAITAVLFTLAAQSRRVSQDSAIGISFVAAFALGLILLSRARGYTGSLEGFLFGSVMSVAPEEVPVLVGLGAVLTVAAVWFTPTFLTVALDRESARAQGLPVMALDLALNLLVTAAIVLSVHVVGNILVVALLVAAPAAARLCTDRWTSMLVLGPVFGALASVAGMWAAWTWDVPAGAAIVLAAAGIFVLTLLVGPRHGLVPVHVLPRLRGRRGTEPVGVEGDGGPAPTGRAVRTRRASAGVAAALAAVVVGAGLVSAPAAEAADAPDRRALHHIHVDATHLHWDDARGLRLDMIEGQATRVPADDVIIDVQSEVYEGVDVATLTVPEPREGRDLSFLGAPGTELWNAPQTLYGDWKPVWVGVGAGAIPATRADITSLRIDLLDVEGPGDVEVFSVNPSRVSRAFSSKDPAHRSFAVKPYLHGHFNWAFTKPGTYTLTFQGHGKDPRTGARIESNRSRVIFRVGPPSAQQDSVPVGPESPRHPGDAGVPPAPADPTPTTPSGPSAPADPAPTTPGGPTTPAPAPSPTPERPAPSAPGSQPAPSDGDAPRPGGGDASRQCPLVLTRGHIDMAVHGGGDGLRAVLKDETRGAAVERRPEDVVLGLTDALQVRVPAGFDAVGEAGSTVWMVPQVQNPGGLWSGFNTQEVDYGSLAGPVSIELTSLSGPGRAVLFEEDLLRGVRVLWDSAPGGSRSFTMAIPSHVHHALAFSAPGRYELGLRYSARNKAGRTVSAPARYTLLVGGAALAEHGCAESVAPGQPAGGTGGDAQGAGGSGTAAGPLRPGVTGVDGVTDVTGGHGPDAGGLAQALTTSMAASTAGAWGTAAGAAEGAPGAAPGAAAEDGVGNAAAGPAMGGAGTGAADAAGGYAGADGAAFADGSAGEAAPAVGGADGAAGTAGSAEGMAAGAPDAADRSDAQPGTGPQAGGAAQPGTAIEASAPLNPVLAGLRQHPEVVPVTGAGLVLLIGVLLWLASRRPARPHSARISTEGTPSDD